MTVSELIKLLSEFPPDMLVMIQDSLAPRLSSGAFEETITSQMGEDSGDCEDLVGQRVALISVY
jgi:hypothetical protein